MTLAAMFRPSFNPVPKELIRHANAQRKQLDEAAEIKRTYRLVDVRDEYDCRCCGGPTTTSPSLLTRRVHNHLWKRSTVPRLQKHSSKNIHLACSRCDALITAGKIGIIGKNCDLLLAFVWTRLATARERVGVRLRDERIAV